MYGKTRHTGLGSEASGGIMMGDSLRCTAPRHRVPIIDAASCLACMPE